jgi:hypothetical protein
MKNLLGDWSRSVERNSAQATSERQIFVTYVTKTDEAVCEFYEPGNGTATSAKGQAQACYLLIDSTA